MTLQNNELMMILGFCVTLIAVITPIIKLNATITRLNTTLENFIQKTEASHEELKSRVDKHGLELDSLQVLVTEIKKDVWHNKEHIKECEIRKKSIRGDVI